MLLLWLFFVLTTGPKGVQEFASLFPHPQSRLRLPLPTDDVNTDLVMVILWPLGKLLQCVIVLEKNFYLTYLLKVVILISYYVTLSYWS